MLYAAKKCDFERKQGGTSESAVNKKKIASYQVAYNIAKESKSFTDGLFVKKCAVEMLTTLGRAEAATELNEVPLSASTIVRRINSIASVMTTNLKEKILRAKFFSIALDESIDVKSTALLLVFIRGIDDNFEAVKQMHGRTTGKHIFDALDSEAVELGMEYGKMISVTSDACPSMVGHASGFVAHLARKVNALPARRYPIVFLRCLIHQEQLCKILWGYHM